MEKNIKITSHLGLWMFLLAFFVLSFQQDPCTPLWPRLEFGRVYSDSSNEERIIIKFNTLSACPKSYATVSDLKGTIRKVECRSSTLTLSEKMNLYKIYQQRCSTEKIKFDEPFEYFIYGANNSASAAVPFSVTPIRTVKIISPNSKDTVRVIVLADWSELNKNLIKYESINSTLDAIRENMNVNGMVINGDIAYDLDSNNGLNYEFFVNMLSRIARYVPAYFNTGNHEHLSDDDLKIFYFAFEQYGKDKKLATGLSLGPLYYIGFDPYDSLYIKKEERQIRLEHLETVETQAYLGLKEWLEKTDNSGKMRVTSSHYPLACSSSDLKCINDRMLLKEFFDLMFEHSINLYLSGHVHTYERIYPYCSNGSFLIKESPYRIEDLSQCLIAVIEGIAGNDVVIVEEYDSIKEFTAKVQYGRTGLGVLEVNPNEVKYQHFVVAEGLSLPNDEMVIKRTSNNKVNEFNAIKHQQKYISID